MSSKRNLKKEINNAMNLLYNDCILYQIVSRNNVSEAAADKIIVEIMGVHSDFLSRVSVSEGKELKNRTKNYYQKLRKDLVAQINRLGSEIQGLE